MFEKRAIIWDFDGTIACLDGLWSGTCKQVLEIEFGVVDADIQIIKNHLSSGFPWHAPDKVRAPISNADIWWHEMDDYFQTLGAKFGLNETQLGGFTQAIRECFLDVSRWSICAGAADTLSHFKVQGIQNYILSNHVPELPALIKNLGMDGYFEAVVSSGLTGVEKPNVKAFDFLPRQLRNMPRKDIVIIGDSLSADYGIAQALNIDFILVHAEPKSDDMVQCDLLVELKNHIQFSG